MTYKIVFDSLALKEWNKLSGEIRLQFKKKLAKRCEAPKIKADMLSGMPGCYKIKLRSSGYRLIYRVENDQIQIIVLAVGKRNRGVAYQKAKLRQK